MSEVAMTGVCTGAAWVVRNSDKIAATVKSAGNTLNTIGNGVKTIAEKLPGYLSYQAGQATTKVIAAVKSTITKVVPAPVLKAVADVGSAVKSATSTLKSIIKWPW
jgi:hypothetical protein